MLERVGDGGREGGILLLPSFGTSLSSSELCFALAPSTAAQPGLPEEPREKLRCSGRSSHFKLVFLSMGFIFSKGDSLTQVSTEGSVKGTGADTQWEQEVGPSLPEERQDYAGLTRHYTGICTYNLVI